MTAAEKKLAEVVASHDCGEYLHDRGCIAAGAREFAAWALEEAIRISGLMRGHHHFDRTGGSGSGCPKCLSIGEAMNELRALAHEVGGKK